jgi:hypothetical protein
VKNYFLILLMISLIGCGTYCIKIEKQSWAATGEICYSHEQSKIEGNVVFLSSTGNKIIGVDENDIKDVLNIIESGKKIWDFGKNFFAVSITETASQRLKRLLKEYKKQKED